MTADPRSVVVAGAEEYLKSAELSEFDKHVCRDLFAAYLDSADEHVKAADWSEFAAKVPGFLRNAWAGVRGAFTDPKFVGGLAGSMLPGALGGGLMTATGYRGRNRPWLRNILLGGLMSATPYVWGQRDRFQPARA